MGNGQAMDTAGISPGGGIGHAWWPRSNGHSNLQATDTNGHIPEFPQLEAMDKIANRVSIATQPTPPALTSAGWRWVGPMVKER